MCTLYMGTYCTWKAIGLMMATEKTKTIIHGQERESTSSYGTGANNRHI